MRITELKTTPVAVPFVEDEAWAFGRRPGLTSVILELETDEGATGLGEAPGYPSAEIVLAVFRSLDPIVVGQDPLRIEHIMKAIDAAGTWHHVGATSTAMAAVEMACWDILGKLAGQPLVNLFGGRVRDAVEYFCYLPRTSPDDVASRAKKGADEGFGTFYMKVGADDPAEDVELLDAIRQGAGPGAKIRVDANEAWSAATAIRAARAFEHLDLEFLEQPVSGRDLSEMAYVRSQIGVPLLANEASWTRYDVLDLIRHGAADAVSIDNQMDSGLANMKRAAGICELPGLPVIKHSLGELGIGTLAAAHLIASTSNFLCANQWYGSLLTDDVVAAGSPFTQGGGRVAVPDAPGIGVELDPDRVARYADLYRERGGEFGFRPSGPITDTPFIPRR